MDSSLYRTYAIFGYNNTNLGATLPVSVGWQAPAASVVEQQTYNNQFASISSRLDEIVHKPGKHTLLFILIS